MRKIRILVLAISAAGWIVMAAPLAGAATPASQACLGSSVSSFSSEHVRSGWLYRDFAQDPNDRPGLGDGVQAFQAGLIPDEVFPNTCNG